MKNLFVLFITLLLLETACPIPFGEPPGEQMLRRACQYLWAQQSTDGGWHSKTHRQLKGGTSLSTFLVYTLLRVPTWIHNPDKQQVDMALDFLREQMEKAEMRQPYSVHLSDRPNYSIAYALLVLKEYGTTADSSLIKLMTEHLKQQQLTEQRGFHFQQYAYGAWGSGENDLQNGSSDYVDLAHTQLVLKALRGCIGFDSIACKANYFLRLAQKHSTEERHHPTGIASVKIPYDGGFFESPVRLSANKAGIQTDTFGVPYYFRSYATATCEGLLALLESGKTKTNKSVADALDWLLTHHKWSRPQGFPLDDPDQWQEALFFYHLSIRAEVYTILNVAGGWQDNVISLLEKRQHANGSFKNELGRKTLEDDPLVATGMAISTLTFLFI